MAWPETSLFYFFFFFFLILRTERERDSGGEGQRERERERERILRRLHTASTELDAGLDPTTLGS